MTGILGLVILILDVIAIVEVLKGNRAVLNKLLWILIILVLPILGMILYYVIGRKAA